MSFELIQTFINLMKVDYGVLTVKETISYAARLRYFRRI